MKISIIGFGNMAKAIAQALLQNPTNQLFATSPSLPVGVNPQGIHTHFDNLSILPDSDIIFLTVKPSMMSQVLMEIRQTIPEKCVVISVAAGLKLDWFSNQLNPNTPIVRAMPNIAAAIGQSATPLIANEFVTHEQKGIVEALFLSIGITNWITDESEIDVYTALSGSGPAYVFLFMESLIDGATSLGLAKDIATSFALQTVLGAVTMAKSTTTCLSDLRAQVTSPAGTTAAAIAVLQSQQMDQIIQAAMIAAYERSKQLSQ